MGEPKDVAKDGYAYGYSTGRPDLKSASTEALETCRKPGNGKSEQGRKLWPIRFWNIHVRREESASPSKMSREIAAVACLEISGSYRLPSAAPGENSEERECSGAHEHPSNDQVEQRAGAPPTNEDDLSQSSTLSLARRIRYSRDRSNCWNGLLITAGRLHISDVCHRYFKAADKFCGGVIEPASQRYED